MSNTVLSIQGDRFLINGKLIYSEYPNQLTHGLLMNARFIQGIYDDASGTERYARFGRSSFDPEQNTQALIDALPAWYRCGLRGITVGLQGGGPVYTISNQSIFNNPFGEDGYIIDPAYLSRLEKLIDAADRLGMVVIVSCFYGVQAARLKDDKAVERAVKAVSNWLRDHSYTNVIIEVANEYNLHPFRVHPVLSQPDGIVLLMDIARRESSGLPVCCSGTGGHFQEEIVKNSDVIMIHGNGLTRQQYYQHIQKCRTANPNVPIVCNEDSPCISRLEVAMKTGTSWGYFNNPTKQEPPTDWTITPGEDTFFALRMASILGIADPGISCNEDYVLQGLGLHETTDGKRWIRLAARYPEKIDYVDFYRDENLFYTSYDEPFYVRGENTFHQSPVMENEWGTHWKAVIHLTDGNVAVVNRTVGEGI